MYDTVSDVVESKVHQCQYQQVAWFLLLQCDLFLPLPRDVTFVTDTHGRTYIELEICAKDFAIWRKIETWTRYYNLGIQIATTNNEISWNKLKTILSCVWFLSTLHLILNSKLLVKTLQLENISNFETAEYLKSKLSKSKGQAWYLSLAALAAPVLTTL